MNIDLHAFAFGSVAAVAFAIIVSVISGERAIRLENGEDAVTHRTALAASGKLTILLEPVVVTAHKPAPDLSSVDLRVAQTDQTAQ